MPPSTDYSHIRQNSEQSSATSSTNGKETPPRRKFNLWWRLRVGVSQMFRRFAIFFRSRQKFRSTSSGGFEPWESYGDEDSVDFLVILFSCF